MTIVSKVIQVRNVPDDVHAELRRRAIAANLSLSDYVLSELERVSARSDNAEVLFRAAMRPGGATRQEILDALDAGRSERG